MKILFLCHRIPYPPNKRDKLRAFYILKHLSKNNEIYLVSLYDDKKDKRHETALRKYCREVHIFYANPLFSKLKAFFWLLLFRSATAGYFYSGRLGKKTRQLARERSFGAVFVCSSSMAQYAADLRAGIKIIDFVDCDSAKWGQYGAFHPFPASLIFALETRRLSAYEKNVIGKFDHALVTTDMEKRRFSEFVRIDKFTVVENGVDVNFFRPIEQASGNKIIFTGAMDYFANVDGVIIFCRKALPLIRREVPGADFYIIGPNPVRAIRSLAAIPGVHVTGFVEDLRNYFGKASVCVVPSFRIAAGIQNKMLEAMASAIPVVTTSAAASSLKAAAYSCISIADSAEEFARRTITLLRDRELAGRMGHSGRRYVEAYHDWGRNLSVLDKMLGTG
ncbi:MAG: TIGR03087 family PEP-CTERM/XrtA system glycosyltransferase [Candidatus Omnitrophica bacterium]|nr:TIGR03087 family PEP-CTERM/XrtA system glycosyltransferase [Candidatus Omnitrophota bacterium]